MIEKTFRNAHLLALRHIRSENDSLPVDERRLSCCLAQETSPCNVFINTNCNSSRALWLLVGWFSYRTGTSVDDGVRKSTNWLDQWLSGKVGTGSRVKSFSRALPSSNDVPALLLNQPNSEFTQEDVRQKQEDGKTFVSEKRDRAINCVFCINVFWSFTERSVWEKEGDVWRKVFSY